MKLERRIDCLDEYRCILTKELDDISGISELHYYDMFHHYILANDCCKEEKCLAIRVPGGTVGDLFLDDNNVITKIAVDINYVVTYPNNTNELIQKFVGEKIEY